MTPMKIHPDFEACRHLWIAVLLQAFQDASQPAIAPLGHDACEWWRNRHQARHFLRNGYGNLSEICERAGVNDEVVLRYGTDPRVLDSRIETRRFWADLKDGNRKKPKADRRGGV